MFLINSAIGNMQVLQSYVVKTFVPLKQYQDPLLQIVGAQTALMKEIVTSVGDIKSWGR